MHRFSTASSHLGVLTILRGFLIGGTVPLPTGTAARADGKTGNGGPENQAGGVADWKARNRGNPGPTGRSDIGEGGVSGSRSAALLLSAPWNLRRSALTFVRFKSGVSMKVLRTLAFAVAALLAACSPGIKDEAAAPSAKAPVTIRFATDWRAQAEHGGFYQALASGEYAKRGLKVEIVQGGPGVNVPQLLASNAVNLGMGSNSFIVMNLAQEGVP
eukprot:gene48035-64457_t